MLETQFYIKIILICVFGCLFVLTMFRMGKANSIEEEHKKHLPLQILSVSFLLLSLVSIVFAGIAINKIDFPKAMLGQPVSPYLIVYFDFVQFNFIKFN